jgi:hypothetical protein
MIADLLTKPLQGEQFRALRNQLLNVNWVFPSKWFLLPTLFRNHSYYFGQHLPDVFLFFYVISCFDSTIPSEIFYPLTSTSKTRTLKTRTLKISTAKDSRLPNLNSIYFYYNSTNPTFKIPIKDQDKETPRSHSGVII